LGGEALRRRLELGSTLRIARGRRLLRQHQRLTRGDLNPRVRPLVELLVRRCVQVAPEPLEEVGHVRMIPRVAVGTHV
jgi:hypothetical protein